MTQLNTLATMYYSSPLSARRSNYSFLYAYKKKPRWYIAITEFNLVVCRRKSLRTVDLNS